MLVFLLVVVVIFGFIWVKFGKSPLDLIYIIQILIKSLRHKSFTPNTKNPTTLSEDNIKALSVGLIISEQNMFYTDTLETGAIAKEQKKRLKQSWGIDSREDAIERLATFGQSHKQYDIAINIYLNIPKQQWETHVDEQFSDDINLEINDYLQSMEEVKTFLISKEITTSEQLNDVLSRGSIAWDLGRLVYIARACYTLDYINQQEAWEAINKAWQKTAEIFSNWQAFGQSYMLGRAIWSSDDMAIDGLVDIFQEAVKENNSPWNKYPL